MDFFTEKNTIFLNEKVSLRKGGRKAVRMSEEVFKEILSTYKSEAAKAGYDVDDRFGEYDWILEDAFDEMFVKLKKDLLKIDFDFENREIESEIYMTNIGVPYLCCWAGGDWECPVRFFIYYDGETLRGYIPTKGNVFNRKTKSAIGNEDEGELSDSCFIVKEACPKLLKEHSFDEINELMENHFDWDRLEFQEGWCLEDFESRLEIRY